MVTGLSLTTTSVTLSINYPTGSVGVARGVISTTTSGARLTKSLTHTAHTMLDGLPPGHVIGMLLVLAAVVAGMACGLDRPPKR